MSGDYKYYDSDDNKQTIHGMIKHEPEWVASRFTHMESQIVELHADNTSLRGNLTTAANDITMLEAENKKLKNRIQDIYHNLVNPMSEKRKKLESLLQDVVDLEQGIMNVSLETEIRQTLKGTE